MLFRSGAEVIAVVYTPGPKTVEIGRGDNRGQKVRHMNVVLSVRVLRDVTPGPLDYELRPNIITVFY